MFKVGDKVKCVYSGASRVLVIGRTYTVSELRPANCIRVKEVKIPHLYHISKFEKYVTFKGNIK